jgi:hypothetical protein
VTFGGVLADYGVTAIVQADGSFSITYQFVGLQSGIATAVTADLTGQTSNTASTYVAAG